LTKPDISSQAVDNSENDLLVISTNIPDRDNAIEKANA